MIYKDERFTIIQPLSRNASCYYGANTQWCISGKNGINHWDAYRDLSIFFFIIDKTPIEPRFAKVAGEWDLEENEWKFYDSTDEIIDFEIIEELYPPNLMNILNSAVPYN